MTTVRPSTVTVLAKSKSGDEEMVMMFLQVAHWSVVTLDGCG
jgi:hypothetical protein